MEGKEMGTIGILTSGGDAPGMNAVVRSVVRSGLFNQMRVVGIRRGYEGLLHNDFMEMSLRSVSGMLEKGGTMLYSARSEEFNSPAGVAKAAKNCEAAGIDGLIVCGGDGSFRGALDLSRQGIPCIGIPGTIDNDIAATDYTIGFDTAVNTVVENVDKLRDTSESHERCSVVEVMGRACGDIALQSAICCGAVSVLIPEMPFELERDIVSKMRNTLNTGKTHFIVIMAEGVTTEDFDAFTLARIIEKETDVETRATVIGHVQRGGSPSARDRIVGSQMGHYAVELFRKGIGNRVVAMRNSKIDDVDIVQALRMTKSVDKEMFRIANEISI